MNKKVKLKGRLNMYMRWPVLLSALLLVTTVLMYLVDYRAGLLMTACFVLYVAAAIVIYFYLKPSIVDELVNFAIEFAQVQHNLIHDLEIPYAILDETGKLLWANSCMKEIMGEFIDMKNISTLIPDIKQEMLPDDDPRKKLVSENLITYVEDRKGHDRRYAIAPDKIKAEIGWEPETMFKEGIRRTIAWFFEHEEWMKNVTSGDYQKYYEDMYRNR